MGKHIDEEKQEQRTMALGLLLIIALFMVMNFMTSPHKTMPQSPKSSVVESAQQPVPVVPAVQDNRATTTNTSSPVITVSNSKLSGSLHAAGPVDNLTLTDYRQTTAKDSPNVVLLTPHDYTLSVDWQSAETGRLNHGTWQVSGDKLTPQTPVVATLQDGDIRLVRTLTVDDNYMLSVADEVINQGDKIHHVALQGDILRQMTELSTSANVHEGFVGLIDDKLVEKKYTDVAKKSYTGTVQNGWFGITDKYWQTIFIPQMPVDVRFDKKEDLYKMQFSSSWQALPPEQKLTTQTRVFMGAKTLRGLNAYQTALDIPKFDLTIDFGWFYFIAKPFLYFLIFLNSLFGNMGVAILVFATLLRLALLPIAQKSYINMAKMKKLQPKMKALQECYGDNKMVLQQETLKLYKQEKINPAGGCLPLLIQIPIFFALYKVLSVSILMRQAPFLGWIHDLSVADPSSVFTAFGLLPWPIPRVLNLGVWPILMGLTMWIQQRLNPAPADKSQAAVFKYLPVIFTFMLGQMASGLVIYWTWSNLLSIMQQKYILKKVERGV